MTGQHERDSAEPAALPTAGYMPVHDPAVHGHAYAVRVPGQDTQPFTAVRPADLPPCRCAECQAGRVPAAPLPSRQPQYEQPCPFGCPVRPQLLGGDPRALLYSGPGIATRNWEAKVREGAWDDIPAVLDAAHARVHMPAAKRNRHIRRDLSNGVHHLGAVFAAHPDWHADAELAEGLHAAEAKLAAQLAEMQRASAERWAAQEGRAA